LHSILPYLTLNPTSLYPTLLYTTPYSTLYYTTPYSTLLYTTPYSTLYYTTAKGPAAYYDSGEDEDLLDGEDMEWPERVNESSVSLKPGNIILQCNILHYTTLYCATL
jgi:hypothetical protein